MDSTITALNQCDTQHLMLFSGKGGVGKTTLSCGFARRWAHQFPNEQILLISTDPAHSLGDVLQTSISNTPAPQADLPNLRVQALDAEMLLTSFKERYGAILELLVERGSFVEGSDLTPVWDLSWPGLDELMGILEIQRLFRDHEADRVVVDMAPTGHSLNLFGLMDFLDNLLESLELFQGKHRELSERLAGGYIEDEADGFLDDIRAELSAGRQLLQDSVKTACLVVAIPEPMSWEETRRFLSSLDELGIPVGGIVVNHLLPFFKGQVVAECDRTTQAEQMLMVSKFLEIAQAPAEAIPVFQVPKQEAEPVGSSALDHLMQQLQVASPVDPAYQNVEMPAAVWPDKVEPGFDDFITTGRQLIILGGKGGVGKTTVAAAIAWGMAERHGDRNIRAISIDPAHSLGDAFGKPLSHESTAIASNLSAQEIDAEVVLEKFREDYLWELAAMMSGDTGDDSLQLAYGPEAWKNIVSQSLPGIDEMLSLLEIVELLESGEQDLIILDTAPTGHLLRFLEMPTALGDWLAWIFKLWIKYQNVVGRVELMGRLRTLRRRVMNAQKKLQDPSYTEFIGVFQAQSAILAESERLTQAMEEKGISHRYVVHNRYSSTQEDAAQRFPGQTVVKLPLLPRAIAPLEQIQGAARLLF
ncbi:MAG: TRC40/GET3/ArsA family transport-energizing ATPase [Elainellaceae cyanobacterium]